MDLLAESGVITSSIATGSKVSEKLFFYFSGSDGLISREEEFPSRRVNLPCPSIHLKE
jgi:hypothetical protein